MGVKQRTIFMTGATGFLGTFILRELLQRECSVVAMVRTPLVSAQERLTRAMRPLKMELASYLGSRQLMLVEGDLPDSLPSPAMMSDLLAPQHVEILANAASLQLHANGNAEPFRTNVEGTRNLIDWADACGITTIHAVSTAYVCGSHTSDVCEVFHSPKPEFKTEYEHSKWIAEGLLEEWKNRNGNSLTVFRPSFLTGDSQTGYTTQYFGFYQLARVVALLTEKFVNSTNGSKGYIPLRIPGSPNDPQNFVPVDFAARIIAEVLADSSLHNRIYHLTDPHPVVNDDIKRHMEDYFGIHGGYFADGAKTITDCNAAESLLWEQFEALTPRVTHNPRFNPNNTLEVMMNKGISFPRLDHDRFKTMIDFAIANNWGKLAG